jgi:Domain of unknown function (DUF5615)
MPTRIRFYADEHIAKAVARGLRRRGVDVLTAQEADLLEASDEEHLARARSESRVIVTQDADFLRFHAAGADHPGIAYAPQGTPIGSIIRGLMLICQILEPDDMVGQLEYL